MICKCGHSKEEHVKIEQIAQVLLGQLSLCQHIYTTEDHQHMMKCICNGYNPDNLKYLEQQYIENINES